MSQATIEINVDQIETVMKEFQADNPGKSADDMRSEEFADRLMKKIMATAPPAPRERSEPPKGFGELPPIEPCEGFRMPTEKEMLEGFGPNFNPHRDSPRERSEHGTDGKEGTGQ